MAGSRRHLRNSLRTGGVAGVATALAAAICGEAENGNAVAPLNAVSHIAWGEAATERNDVSWKYTASGLALNLAATTSWATMYEVIFGRAVEKGDVAKALVGGAVVSGLAYVTDYHIVPARLTPGFEKRLSGRSLFGIYTVLALGLAVGSLWRHHDARSEN